MGDVSSGNGSMKNHTLSQHDWDYFKETDGGVENGDVSIGYSSTNIQTIYEHNGLK